MIAKIKVLQLQLHFNVFASDLAEQINHGLPDERYVVTSAFLCDRPGAEDLESCASRSIYFDFKKSDLKGLKRFLALWRLYKHCNKEDYDVIIAHRFKPINMLMFLNLILNIPTCIGIQHGIGDFDRFFRRLAAKLLFRSNWRMVGVSRAVRDYLINCDAGDTLNKSVQINNAIDINRAEQMQLTREDARTQLNLKPDTFILGCIGRLVPVKGHIYLIEAFSRLQAQHPNVAIAIIGEGRSRSTLEDAIEKFGLSEHVHLLGARKDALQFVRAFDTFIMPSLSEGLPLALLEGMSGHLPVLGSDIVSLRSIIEDCGGRIFKSKDVNSLAKNLEILLQQTPLNLRAEGEKAYEYLCAKHDINSFRHQYRSLIEESLSTERMA